MTYDVAVIGGGITGAGILRDCALRGLKAVLLEKGLPGRATTASSTHLIHGGLRYLLYDRLTTHETCWDAGNIVRIARPLLRRLPILWPVYRGHRHGMETVETLLESYDRFSMMKEGLPHRRLNAEETARLVPSLQKEGLLGSLGFDEWWVDPVALVEANLDSARAAGAEIRTSTAAAELLREGPPARARVVGVKARGASGSLEEIRASVVVNASGPWTDRVAGMAGVRVPLRLRKGSHLVCEEDVLSLARSGTDLGLLLEAEDRERYVFAIRMDGRTLIGPTDLDAPGDPDALATDPEEVRYLLASTRGYFPSFSGRFDRAVVGARPILGQAGLEKLLSREYEVIDHESRDGIAGLVTTSGGKMSDFRLMAEETADLVCGKLGRRAACLTASRTLSGEALPPRPVFPQPDLRLKRFLRGHPRLRELHALAHLGWAFAGHAARRYLDINLGPRS